MKPIIEVKNVGKTYKISLNKGKYVALRDVITEAFKNPFRALKKKKKDEFEALKGVSFDVMPGEVIGVIGHNGAGKSTLLKILTGITPPTTGEITMRGHVSSLLEVGTGFHPELSGRENILLNGAILGMKRADTIRKFDEIVAFAGDEVARFLDTPVKYYSSGMYVRLAFSVAAHLEPDILLVDEVLAVGDSDFQKKCLGKMEDVSKEAGRTILFVSHNMGAINRLCTRTILLDHGKIKMMGATRDVIDRYLSLAPHIGDSNVKLEENADGLKGIVGTKIAIKNDKGEPTLPEEGGAYSLELGWRKEKGVELSKLDCAFAIHNSQGILVTRLSAGSIGTSLEANGETGTWTCKIDKNLLPRGNYYSNIQIGSSRGIEYWKVNAFSFTVGAGAFQNNTEPKFHNHLFHQPQSWING